MTAFEKAAFKALLTSYPIAVGKVKELYFNYLHTRKSRAYEDAVYAWRKQRTEVSWLAVQILWREEYLHARNLPNNNRQLPIPKQDSRVP